MGFISDAIGLSGNNNFQQGNAGPVTQSQIQQAANQTQSGLEQQQNFVNALQAQNGIGNQTAAFNQLQGLANGTGPNPALAQLAQQTQANVQQQAALQAGQRGANQNVGLMARNIANQGANVQQQGVGQAATLQAQQQANAINAMGGLATQQVAQQGNAITGYNQAAQGEQGNILNAFGNHDALNAAATGQNAQAKSAGVGSLLSSAGGAASMLSDERQKTNIKNADGQVKDFLDNMGAHSYEYKDPTLPGASPGEHVSPMAQELEKSQMGKELVHDTPNGKMVDTNASIGALLAANAHLNKRLEAMEQKYAQGGEVQHFDEGGQSKAPVSRPGWAAFQSGFPGSNVPKPQPTPDANKKENYALGGPVQQIKADALPQAQVQNFMPNPMQKKPTEPVDAQHAMAGTGIDPMTGDILADNEVTHAASPLDSFSLRPAPQAVPGLTAPGMGAQFGGGADPYTLGVTGAMAMPTGPKMFARGGSVRKERSHVVNHLMGIRGPVTGPMLAAKGAVVPGQAKVKGNSLKNDTVDAKLSPGEIVIPRSITQDKDAAAKSAAFVESILSKKARSSKAKKK